MKNKLVTTVMTMGFRRRSIRNLLRPSVSAYVIINLDETVITEVIEDLIIDGLVERNKQFMKIAFVGVDRKHHNKFKSIHSRGGAIVGFLNDYEKAKEWVLQV